MNLFDNSVTHNLCETELDICLTDI